MGIETIVKSPDATRLATGFQESGFIVMDHTSGRYKGYVTVREARNQKAICCFPYDLDTSKKEAPFIDMSETGQGMDMYARVEEIYHSVFGQEASVNLVP